MGQDGEGQWESWGVAVEHMGGVAMDHGSGPWKKVGSSWRREETPEWDGHGHVDVPASLAGFHTREPAPASSQQLLSICWLKAPPP